MNTDFEGPPVHDGSDSSRACRVGLRSTVPPHVEVVGDDCSSDPPQLTEVSELVDTHMELLGPEFDAVWGPRPIWSQDPLVYGSPLDLAETWRSAFAELTSDEVAVGLREGGRRWDLAGAILESAKLMTKVDGESVLRWRDARVSAQVQHFLHTVTIDRAHERASRWMQEIESALISPGVLVAAAGTPVRRARGIKRIDPPPGWPRTTTRCDPIILTQRFVQCVDHLVGDRKVADSLCARWARHLRRTSSGEYELPGEVFDQVIQAAPVFPQRKMTNWDHLWVSILTVVWPLGHTIVLGHSEVLPVRVESDMLWWHEDPVAESFRLCSQRTGSRSKPRGSAS